MILLPMVACKSWIHYGAVHVPGADEAIQSSSALKHSATAQGCQQMSQQVLRTLLLGTVLYDCNDSNIYTIIYVL